LHKSIKKVRVTFDRTVADAIMYEVAPTLSDKYTYSEQEN